MRVLAFLLIITLMAYTQAPVAQTRQISGVVVSDKKKIIPFATVHVKGTYITIVANELGSFRLNVSPNAVLKISDTGFEALEIKPRDVFLKVVLKMSEQ